MKPRLVASFFTRKQEYQALQTADVHEAARRCGFEIEILDADENPVLQIQQLFRVIHEPERRPWALIVQTRVADGLERVARNATGAGIGWVLLNRTAGYLEALRNQYPTLALSSITADNEEIGRIQARQFRALLPRGGALLYVQGPPETSAAKARLAGAQAGLQDAGIELRVLVADWTEASGEDAVATWLRLKTSEQFKPDVVGCQNDALAQGARRALRSRVDLGHVRFTGCDGLPSSGQRLVGGGELAATIVIDSCAGPAVELLQRSLKTGERPPRVLVVGPRSFPPVEAIEASTQ